MGEYDNYSVEQLEAEYKRLLKEKVNNTARSRLETSREASNMASEEAFETFKADFIESMKNKEGIELTGARYEDIIKSMVQGRYRRKQ